MASTVKKVLTNKKLSFGSALGIGLNAYSTISDYKQARTKGRGKFSSGISAAGNAIMYEAIGWKGVLGLQAVEAAPNLIVGGMLKANSIARSMDHVARNVPFNNSTFVDSQHAYTMRQAGMQLAEASKYNVQQTLMGNEASAMRRL